MFSYTLEVYIGSERHLSKFWWFSRSCIYKLLKKSNKIKIKILSGIIFTITWNNTLIRCKRRLAYFTNQRWETTCSRSKVVLCVVLIFFFIFERECSTDSVLACSCIDSIVLWSCFLTYTKMVLVLQGFDSETV